MGFFPIDFLDQKTAFSKMFQSLKRISDFGKGPPFEKKEKKLKKK
jgi:hypothetical protein